MRQSVAIIPARGGSKRIKDKNIRDFCGRPMISYSISTAFRSGIFDRVIVSTDSPIIANIAKEYGAEVPFMRPADLSDDYTPTIPVIAHAVSFLCSQVDLEFACCIYPAAPLIAVDDVVKGKELLERNPEIDFSFPVTTFEFPIFRALWCDKGRVSMYWPENELMRSQDLPEAWHDAGQFYWGRAKAWMSAKGIFSSASAPVPIPRGRVQDIDTLEDWKRAEYIFRSLQFYD